MIYILSGPSGSGKSTWTAKQRDGVVISADHFHMPNIGLAAVPLNDLECMDKTYVFDPDVLADAHVLCFRAYLRHLHQTEIIVIDNTNVWAAEKAPYYLAAQAASRDVTIIRFNTPLEACIARSKIPANVVRQQYHVHHARTHQGHLREHMPWWIQADA